MLSNTLLKGLKASFSTGKNFYSVLGVNKTADATEIKKAYFKLAKENHPDRNQSVEAKEKFKQASEAYETLSDDKRRRVYDASGFGHEARRERQSSGFSRNSGFRGFEDFGDFVDIEDMDDFEDIFGFKDFIYEEEPFERPRKQKKNKKVEKGADVVMNITIDFMESIKGCVKEVTLRVKDLCKTCKGSRCRPGTAPVKCRTCAGHGRIILQQGKMFLELECGDCNGVGLVIKKLCQNCKGEGFSNKSVKEKISIPQGAEDGDIIKINEKGNCCSKGGQKGDLIIKLTVRGDRYFRRDKFNIFTDLSLSVTQAVLGGEVNVLTISGVKTIDLSPGINHGAKIKIPGEGILNSSKAVLERGDHFVNLYIKIPTNITPEQKEVYQQLKDIDEKI